MADNIIDAQISLINVHGRFRKDFGNIPALAESIKELGLLQPIGIDSGYRLVFGERRLRAFKHLGRDTIPVRFVNLESLMKGELAENEFRKDFTPSERVAIGEAIEVELGNRAGRPTSSDKTIVENFPQLNDGEKTRDIAAKAAGFGNGKTYEQAKAVTNNAAPELVLAMDEGRASVSAAASLLTLPKAEQAAAATGGKKSIQKAAKAAKKSKPPTVNPVCSERVMRVINSMDILARYALSQEITATQLANTFLDEVDQSNPVIADRMKVAIPFMKAMGYIASEIEAES